jgi:hypothetical protein
MALCCDLGRPGDGIERLPCEITILRDAKSWVERRLDGLTGRCRASDSLKRKTAARYADPS